MYLQIDERTDVLASLSLCLRCLRAVKSEPAIWKWAILALHNTLQGAMVCHLSGTAQLGALRSKSVDAWRDWHERDRRGEIRRVSDGIDEFGQPQTRFATSKDFPPDERLADAAELFERLYNQDKRREGGAGAKLDVGEDKRDSFRRLHRLRNNFAHFTPKGWSIELDGLPRIFLNMVEVLDSIAGDPWPFRHMKEDEFAQLTDFLEQLRDDLVVLDRD